MPPGGGVDAAAMALAPGSAQGPTGTTAAPEMPGQAVGVGSAVGAAGEWEAAAGCAPVEPRQEPIPAAPAREDASELEVPLTPSDVDEEAPAAQESSSSASSSERDTTVDRKAETAKHMAL